MFPGGSCYPQSPVKDGDDTVNHDDQIIKILEAFPSNDKEQEFSFVSKESILSYTSQI